MKGKLKRTLASILATVTVLSAFAVCDISTSAANVDETSVSAQVVSEEVAEEPTTVEPTENVTVEPTIATEPTEAATIATEPATEPATEETIEATEPTVQPTTVKPAPTVGKIQNVEKTSFNTNSITLKWDKVSGATGYVVYYADASASTLKYKLLYVGKGNTVTLKNAKDSTPYYFKMYAYINQNGKKYTGPQYIKKTATQPKNISGLKMEKMATYNQFSWTRNSNATGYKIYRACYKTDGSFTLYKTITDNTVTTFKDTNAEVGHGYYYYVKAYLKTSYAEYNSVDRSYIRFVCGLSAPDFSLSSELSKITLSWSKNKYATGYDVYYSTSSTGSFTRLGSTTSTNFTTKTLTTGKTYYFAVRPYNIYGSNKYKIQGEYKTKSIKVTNSIKGYNVGSTFILIDTNKQHMWYYVNNEVYVSTDVVTGNYGTNDTPKGLFSVYNKVRGATLTGPGYSTYVNYWIGVGGRQVGIHDSTWRTSGYGGNIYKGDGSHGCINTPYDAVKKIFNKVTVGTPILVL